MNARKKIKVLVIRFSSIGDIVLTTPVLRCLKKIPDVDTEVHVVTKSAFRDVLLYNPHVDHLHLLEDDLFSLAKRIASEHIDYIVDVHHNLRSAILKAWLRKPSSSFRKLNFEKWLLVQLKLNRLPDVHVVDRYFEAAAFLGVQHDGKGLDFYLPEKTKSVDHLLPGSFAGGFMTFAIGGKHATKRLPNELIIDIIRKLNHKAVLLGDDNDKNNGRLIASACGDLVYNGCGQFSLIQSATLVKKADYVISHDTGLMHIAAAFEKPLVSIWGSTIPGFGMTPYMPGQPWRSEIIEVTGLSCRPCSKLGHKKCPKGHFDCMMKIDVQDVVEAVRRVTS